MSVNTITVKLAIEERRLLNGRIEATVQCSVDESGEVTPATRRFAKMLSEHMRIAVKASQTTLNEAN